MTKFPIPLSILDLAPVATGSTVGDALRNSVQLARRAEKLGYHRVWVAEHHSMPGVASSAPAVLLAHMASATTTIRLGSGGVMLPNHSPLAIAEQFGTLEAIHPGRIDLGLGRAPGTNPETARVLRGGRLAESEQFTDRLGELMDFFGDSFPQEHPYSKIRAVPGAGHSPAIWILGSSDFGARLAAQLGLPFSFAHHFGVGGTEEALEIYNANFIRSLNYPKPYSMIGVPVLCASDYNRARYLASASAYGFLMLRRGRPRTTPSPEEAAAAELSPMDRGMMEQKLNSMVLGTGEEVRTELARLQRLYDVDEMIISTSTFDHTDRVRSYEILADACGLTC